MILEVIDEGKLELDPDGPRGACCMFFYTIAIR